MKKLLQISLWLLFVSIACAQETSAPKEKVLRVYDWKDLNVQQKLPGSEIISIDGISTLKIQITNSAPLEISLLKVKDSSILKKIYSTHFSFAIKEENVALKSGAEYLELSSEFPPRAVGGDKREDSQAIPINGGPFGEPISINWQPCGLKVGWMEGSLPTQLELKLHLVGSGTIYLRPIKLMGTAESSNWWTPEQAGAIGGIGGALIGCFGGLIGLLAGKGKARNFVLTTIKIFIALGIILLVAGIAAIALRQPYAVWYALLLPGFILTLVFSLNLPAIQRRYDELEIRRMTSVDTMGS